MKKLDILRAMQERGINKATLCKRTGLATQNINSVIDGNPTVNKLQQIAEGIGCDITDLFFSEQQEAPVATPAEEQTAEQGTAEAQVGFFVFGGKRFKIVECE